jgi:hypothetical protein
MQQVKLTFNRSLAKPRNQLSQLTLFDCGLNLDPLLQSRAEALTQPIAGACINLCNVACENRN